VTDIEEQRAAWRERTRRYRQAHPERVRLANREAVRRYREVNRDRVLESNRRWREANPEQKRRSNQEWARTTAHGITRTIRDWMYESQGRACAGCGTPMADFDLDIDHDHACCPGDYSCGRCVRGLVCRSCNIADVLVGVFAARFEGSAV
jgi:hypothetical protein